MIAIRIKNADPLFDIREAIAATLGKDSLPAPKEDLFEYYKKLIVQNHSVVRAVTFRIKDTESDKAVARQLLRATTGHPQPYMQSSRPDWCGKERDEFEKVFFLHDHTAESFLNEARQRLCYRAWKPTREKVLDIVRVMWNSDDPYFKALAFCAVPNCVMQYGCPEGKFNCGWWDRQDFPADIMTRRYTYLHMFVAEEET